jgi:hypothetical protein
MYDTFRNCKIYFEKFKNKGVDGLNNVFIIRKVPLNSQEGLINKKAPSGRRGHTRGLLKKWVNALKQACHPSATHYSKTEQIAMPGTSIF